MGAAQGVGPLVVANAESEELEGLTVNCGIVGGMVLDDDLNGLAASVDKEEVILPHFANDKTGAAVHEPCGHRSGGFDGVHCAPCCLLFIFGRRPPGFAGGIEAVHPGVKGHQIVVSAVHFAPGVIRHRGIGQQGKERYQKDQRVFGHIQPSYIR